MRSNVQRCVGGKSEGSTASKNSATCVHNIEGDNVVPVLQTLNVLMDADLLSPLASSVDGLEV